jgi:ParB family chromosome partitioning protein
MEISMSENVQQHKNPNNKGAGKGLGRGLGSLLSGEDGAFAKNSPGADKTLAVLNEKLPSRKEPALQQGFTESRPANSQPAQAATSPAQAAAPTPQPVAAAAPSVPNHLRVWNIAIEKIQPNPSQPRQIFDQEPLQELANSIREKGVIQPILLHKKGENFEIIAGERRWRAAQIAGLKEIPALIKETGDQEVLELALIENIQRENLTPIEEAEAYDYLMKK